MGSDQTSASAAAAGAEPQTLAELFHHIGSVVPEVQTVSVHPRATVAEALNIMQAHSYSQLPVVAGNQVLGLFSYRSLARGLLRMGLVTEQIGSLPVDEFVEPAAFAQPSDHWEAALQDLSRLDAVLVGSRERLQGIVTAMDILDYLHSIARPFVMLAEIELSLWRIIRGCLSEHGLLACIDKSLSEKYKQTQMPTDLSEMTLDDYAQIICHGRNWARFEPAFGAGEWQRKNTVMKLGEVRQLRNDVFHFRRRLEAEDVDRLSAHRDWLQLKVTQFEATRDERLAAREPAPPGCGTAQATQPQGRAATRRAPVRKATRVATERLPRAKKTPPAAYREPILKALVEMGGRARSAAVLDRVLEMMEHRLNDHDLEKLPSSVSQRWRNTAEWCRYAMCKEGLLNPDSPQGTWEITDEGRRWLAERERGTPA